MSNKKEDANKQYLNSLFDDKSTNTDKSIENTPINTDDVKEYDGDLNYTNVDISMLPSGRFYKIGTKIKIRPAKVYEIQAYSVVDDKNFLDVTDKMNEILSRNIIYIFPDGSKGSYRNIKDSDRIYLFFIIRELTFQGGNTLTKSVTCSCKHKFEIPFRATTGKAGKATFELHNPTDDIARFFKANECAYELVYNNVSWKLAPPTIGIQESFYDEIKRNVQNEIKPDVAFMKIIPFMLYDKGTITEEEISSKLEDFKTMDDMKLSQAIRSIVDNMTVGIKGLVMECPECGSEVHTDLTFPNGASTLFDIPNILDDF